jgi:hypothetical protein
MNNDLIRNQAYEKLMAALGNQSSWGTNLAEVGQAVSTCQTRLGQMGAFARALGKRDFFGAAKALKQSVVPTGVSGHKAFADNFLEYHFGWEPMMADIHDACQTMSKADFGSRKIRGSASSSLNSSVHTDYGPGQFTNEYLSGSLQFKSGCTCRITNDSAFLASQLGLVNPLTVAWDLVPYSFVVDWFANVGQVLGAVTGFVGVEVTQAYSTQSQETTYSKTSVGQKTVDGHFVPTSQTFTQHDLFIQRDPGIAGPVLTVRPFKGFSATRGATACALLLQFL